MVGSGLAVYAYDPEDGDCEISDAAEEGVPDVQDEHYCLDEEDEGWEDGDSEIKRRQPDANHQYYFMKGVIQEDTHVCDHTKGVLGIGR